MKINKLIYSLMAIFCALFLILTIDAHRKNQVINGILNDALSYNLLYSTKKIKSNNIDELKYLLSKVFHKYSYWITRKPGYHWDEYRFEITYKDGTTSYLELRQSSELKVITGTYKKNDTIVIFEKYNNYHMADGEYDEIMLSLVKLL